VFVSRHSDSTDNFDSTDYTSKDSTHWDSCVESHCSAVRNLPAPQEERLRVGELCSGTNGRWPKGKAMGMGVGSVTFHRNDHLLMEINVQFMSINVCFPHTDFSDSSDFIYCKNHSNESSVFVSRHWDSTDNFDSTDYTSMDSIYVDSCVESHCSAVRNLPAPQGEGMGVGSVTFHRNDHLLMEINVQFMSINVCFPHTDSSDSHGWIPLNIGTNGDEV